MQAKKIILFILFCVFTLCINAQNLLPYTQDNICLDQLINVNANPLSNTKNLVVRDLNNDGIKEVLVADATASIIKIYSFIPATATFSFQNFINVPGTFGIGKQRAIDAGKFTGDALDDIIFTTDSTIFVFKNNNNYAFSQIDQIPIPPIFMGQEHYLRVDNINNNGLDEFYLISSNTAIGPGVTVVPFINTGSGITPLAFHTIFKSSGNLLGASLDINLGNVKGAPGGLKDLMITYSNVPDSVFFLENNSLATTLLFNDIYVYLPPTFPFTSPDFTITSSELADVNSDSKLDFIFAGHSPTGNRMAIYAGLNSFSLPLHVDIPISAFNINDFKIADINDDNVDDFIAIGNYLSSSFSGMAIFTGNATSSYFDPGISITFTNNSMRPDELQITDVDQNGVNDLVIKPWKLNNDRTYLIPNFSFNVNVTGFPLTTCGITASTLNAVSTSSSTNFDWECVQAGAVVATSSSFTTITAGDYVASLHIPMYSNYTCTQKSDTIKIISNGPVITVSSQNTTVCYGNYASASASGASTYTWSSPSASPIFFGPTFSIQVLSPVVFTVTGQIPSGCKGTNTVALNLFPLNTDVISSSKNPACIGDVVSLSMPTAVTYTWSNGTNNAVANVTPNATSVYSLTFTDANGCSSAKTITVDIDPKCSPKIYNGITINGDGINDFFEIENIEKFKGNSVKIYNRWGKEIFTTINYDNKTNYWPTADNLKTLTPSTYFYLINYGDGSEIQRGWVELITN
ncbi:MAG: gliding motility-associated C-terminal domain-containing protein [Bacteroidetes bacterium]|nr:gliding motility-associated C-terminal domain-containing protein [Bacteroidota bacterium]